MALKIFLKRAGKIVSGAIKGTAYQTCDLLHASHYYYFEMLLLLLQSLSYITITKDVLYYYTIYYYNYYNNFLSPFPKR